MGGREQAIGTYLRQVKPLVFVHIFLFLEEQEKRGVRQVDRGGGLVFVRGKLRSYCEMEAVCRQTRRVQKFCFL